MNPHLIKSIVTKDLELFTSFYEKEDFDPSFDDNYTLRTASKLNCLEMVKMILKHPKFDKYKKSELVLGLSIYSKNYLLIEFLFNHPLIDKNRYSIEFAIDSGIHLNDVKSLTLLTNEKIGLDLLKSRSFELYHKINNLNKIKNF
jgi:hypothetical protein